MTNERTGKKKSETPRTEDAIDPASSKSGVADTSLETLHETDPLISLSEFARRINKHQSTVWRWARDGLFTTSRSPSGLQSVRTSVANTFLRGTAITGRV